MFLLPESQLLEKYNIAGPRYTSYPTAPVWTENYTNTTHLANLIETNASISSTGHPEKHPVALYTHVPFCEARCLFCGCNVVITKKREQAQKYLNYLFKEMTLVSDVMDSSRPVTQLHWGGGTPTYLSESEMVQLFEKQTTLFNIAPDAEIAIEVDPRVTTESQLKLLRSLGFNRISLGVQDFMPEVQAAVKRIQPYDLTAGMVNQCRELEFSGINFDLIYGLPHQTEQSFEETLNDVIRLAPDRIALYSYAHVPWLSPHQKSLDENALPAPEQKFKILQLALSFLNDAGYVYIGMDHFAKPDDELSQALHNGNLYRNFMGYTVLRQSELSQVPELYGFGVSAISGLTHFFSQNQKKLSAYYHALDNNQLATLRGYSLSPDDKIRQTVILKILCTGFVDFNALDAQFQIDSKAYFKSAFSNLHPLENDGLLTFTDNRLTVTPSGRLLSRNIAMAFDAYLEKMQAGSKSPTFSKTV
ncbi:MAG: oxygen-independent coproporphyrinogen III oxidase [Cyanobacteria bacterium P01_H01_bin.74]